MAKSLRLSVGRRACWLDVAGDRVRLGSEHGNAIMIRHPSVLSQHAELLFRPAGTILRPLGQARVYLGETAVETPVVLSDQRGIFRLGDVAVRLESSFMPSLRGRQTHGERVERRIDGLESGLQRYVTEEGNVVTQGEQLRQLVSREIPHLSLLGPSSLEPAIRWAVERAPRGVQLSSLIARGRLVLPPAAKLRVVAHVATALDGLHRAGGVHGAFSSRFVRITATGDAHLLRSWAVKPQILNATAPERRWGVQASSKTDVYEWAGWALGWLGPSSELTDLLRRHRMANPKDRDSALPATIDALQKLAWSGHADPGQGALARAAQLGVEELSAAPLAITP